MSSGAPSYIGCIYTDTHNILLLCWPFYHCIVSSLWHWCRPVLSDVSVWPCFLVPPLHETPFPIPLLPVSVSFALKSVSRRRHSADSCFIVQSATVCLLIGAFNPLIFKVIVDKYILYCHFTLVFRLILHFFFVPFFLLWFNVMFVFLLVFMHRLYVFICGYLSFKHVNSFLYPLDLDWQLYRLKHILLKKIYKFSYSPPPYFVIWCLPLHLHVYRFTIHCAYCCFH